MGIIVSFIVTIFSNYFFYNEFFAIYLGLFSLLGFVTHLLLDEFYSAVMLKKSFGTAFKLYSKNNSIGYFILYGLICFLFFYNPFILPTLLEITQ
jgi:hypothetical protein